jgi:hypothetical protein
MAASSKKPPCSHEDVNSIFLNSETVLFLHQIFLKGLTSRMESWPTLVLGKMSHHSSANQLRLSSLVRRPSLYRLSYIDIWR